MFGFLNTSTPRTPPRTPPKTQRQTRISIGDSSEDRSSQQHRPSLNTVLRTAAAEEGDDEVFVEISAVHRQRLKVTPEVNAYLQKLHELQVQSLSWLDGSGSAEGGAGGQGGARPTANRQIS